MPLKENLLEALLINVFTLWSQDKEKQTLEQLIRQTHDSNTGLLLELRSQTDFVPICSPHPCGVKQIGKTEVILQIVLLWPEISNPEKKHLGA